MDYRDYYRILGIDRKASEKEIKQAYRRLARQYHPDVNPSDQAAQEKFKEINEAYEVLSDPEKRRKYDKLGAQWQNWQRMGFEPSSFDWGQWFAQPGGGARVKYVDLEDLFGEASPFSEFFNVIFGSPRTRTRTRVWQTAERGRDLEQLVEITLQEAFTGTKRTLSISGRRIEVKIPPGVDTGSRVRVAGQGAPGMRGGSPGDLYLRIAVAPDRQFQRRDDNLYLELPVDIYTALLGGEVKVPTPKGIVMLKIPPGTQGGKVFRLQGQGMLKLKKPQERGDLFAKVKLRIPENLSKEEKELFERLAKMRHAS